MTKRDTEAVTRIIQRAITEALIEGNTLEFLELLDKSTTICAISFENTRFIQVLSAMIESKEIIEYTIGRMGPKKGYMSNFTI